MPDQEASQIGGTRRPLNLQEPLTISNRDTLLQPKSSSTTAKPSTRQMGTGGSNTQANITIRTAQSKKRKNHQNQFKEKSMSDKDVIDFL
jgi:hypothetical protein